MLTLAETPDRKEILVSIQQNDDKGRLATVRLSADQFEELCRADSSYDGLEVDKLEQIQRAKYGPTSPESIEEPPSMPAVAS